MNYLLKEESHATREPTKSGTRVNYLFCCGDGKKNMVLSL